MKTKNCQKQQNIALNDDNNKSMNKSIDDNQTNTHNREYKDYLQIIEHQTTLQFAFINSIQRVIKEYFKMIPQLNKAKQQTSTLVQYNKTLYQILMKFQTQEHSLISKLKKLEQIHLQTYTQYCKMKGKQPKINRIKQPDSIFANFDLTKLHCSNIESFDENFRQNQKLENIIMKNCLNNIDQIQMQVKNNIKTEIECVQPLKRIHGNIEKYKKMIKQKQNGKQIQVFEALQLKLQIENSYRRYLQANQQKMTDIPDTSKCIAQIYQQKLLIQKTDQKTLLKFIDEHKVQRKDRKMIVHQLKKKINNQLARLQIQLAMSRQQYDLCSKKCAKLSKQLIEYKLSRQIQTKKIKSRPKSYLNNQKTVIINSSKDILEDNQEQSTNLKMQIKQLQNRIKENYDRYKKQINKYQSLLKGKEQQIINKLSNRDKIEEQLRIEIQKLQESDRSNIIRIRQFQQQQQFYKQKLQNRQQLIIELQDKMKKTLKKTSQSIKKCREQVQFIENQKQQMQRQLNKKQQIQEQLNKKITILQQQLENCQISIPQSANQKDIYNKLNQKIKDKNIKITNLKQINQALQKEVQALLSEVQGNKRSLSRKQQFIAQKQVQIHHIMDQKQKITQQVQFCSDKLHQVVESIKVQYIQDLKQIMGEQVTTLSADIPRTQLIKNMSDILSKALHENRELKQKLKQIKQLQNSMKNPQKIQKSHSNHQLIDQIHSNTVSKCLQPSNYDHHLSMSVQQLAQQIQDYSKDYWQLYKRYQQAIQCLEKQENKNFGYQLKYQKFVEDLELEINQLPEDAKKQTLQLRIYHLNRLAKQQRQTIQTQRKEYNNIFKEYHNQFKSDFELQIKNLRNSRSLPI